jgi:hypothetical protein
MKTFLKPLVAAIAALAMIAAPIAVQARNGAAGFSHGGGFHGGRGGWGHGGGHWGGGYWGPGPFWGGIGLGIGLGALAYYGAYDGYYYPYPGYVVSDPGYVVVNPPPANVVPSTGQPVPNVARAADPIFYPRNGQSAAQTETDRQDCNRWATTQAGAMNDASIFQRATFACMDGRGYTAR